MVSEVLVLDFELVDLVVQVLQILERVGQLLLELLVLLLQPTVVCPKEGA